MRRNNHRFAVAKLYFRLKIDGSIPSSEARSKEMKNEIDRMIELGIIEDVRVRNGTGFPHLSKECLMLKKNENG